MKKMLKGYVLGFLSAALIVSSIGYAANTTTLYNVLLEGVKIVVDGQKINPTDANGNTVEPIIYNGTTYLPVRAVANAIGKAVYWDGPNYTVYLGNMDGKLEYPTAMLKDMTSISKSFNTSQDLVDNYDNQYGGALKIASSWNKDLTYEYLLNMKYSHFRAILYVPKGTGSSLNRVIAIKADDKQIYSSPVMDKTTGAVYIDVDITGCNKFEIISPEHGDVWGDNLPLCLADAGFYQ